MPLNKFEALCLEKLVEFIYKTLRSLYFFVKD